MLFWVVIQEISYSLIVVQNNRATFLKHVDLLEASDKTEHKFNFSSVRIVKKTFQNHLESLRPSDQGIDWETKKDSLIL